MPEGAIDKAKHEAHLQARSFLRRVLDAAAQAEGYANFRDAFWDVSVAPFEGYLAGVLVEYTQQQALLAKLRTACDNYASDSHAIGTLAEALIRDYFAAKSLRAGD